MSCWSTTVLKLSSDNPNQKKKKCKWDKWFDEVILYNINQLIIFWWINDILNMKTYVQPI